MFICFLLLLIYSQHLILSFSFVFSSLFPTICCFVFWLYFSRPCFYSFPFSNLTHIPSLIPSPYTAKIPTFLLLLSSFIAFFPLLFCLTLFPPYSVSFLSVLPTSSALRSCSTGDSLLSSAFIRSAKSAPALAPPLPVLLHHHHPLLPPLADQLAGTHTLHYLSACLRLRLKTLVVCTSVRDRNVTPVVSSLSINFSWPSVCHYWSNSLHVVHQSCNHAALLFLTCNRDDQWNCEMCSKTKEPHFAETV